MNDQIICPHCKKPIPLTEALSHQVQEKYQRFYKIRLEEEKKKIENVMREELGKKIKSEMELQFRDKSNEAAELKKQNQALQEQLLELNKLIRQLRTEGEQKTLELEKKLAVEQEKIRLEEGKRLDEEYRLKLLDKDKKIQDTLKEIQEYKRKLEQGSQQTQGEVLELELENILKREFPYDEINEVPKGVTGADLIQTVKNNYGKTCGTIIWESKRTRTWTEGWIQKLKEDQRQVKAEAAVIISQTLPDGIKTFKEKNGVWIGGYDSIIGLGTALRNSLIQLYGIKSSFAGKGGKQEILWNYLTSTEFKQRVEAVYDAYSQMMTDLKKERDWFTKKWAKQEKSIQKVAENILGMHGDLEGIVGKSLPEITGLGELPASTEEEKVDKDGLF